LLVAKKHDIFSLVSIINIEIVDFRQNCLP